jgi:hypothetical protein
MYVQQVASGDPIEGFMYVPHSTWLLLPIYLQIVAKNKVLNGKKEVFGLSLWWNWELCRFIKIGNGIIALGHTISSSLCDLNLFVNELIWNLFFRLFGLSFQWNWDSCSRFIKILSCDWKQVHTFTHIFHLSALPILHPTHWFGFNFVGGLIGLVWASNEIGTHVSDSSKFELL